MALTRQTGSALHIHFPVFISFSVIESKARPVLSPETMRKEVRMSMSVILFQSTEVYQEMADAFEEIKYLLKYRSWGDERFYKALRRLYFANVATYLCQYHDDSPLSQEELTAIESFQKLDGKRRLNRTPVQSINAFL